MAEVNHCKTCRCFELLPSAEEVHEFLKKKRRLEKARERGCA